MLQRTVKQVKAVNQIQGQTSVFGLIPKDLNKLNKNQMNCLQGVKNYNAIMSSYADQFQTIGFENFVPKQMSKYVNPHSFHNPGITDRPSCFIYYKYKTAMHKHPYAKKTGQQWIVQQERSNTLKTNCMSWNFVNDSFSKRTEFFNTLEDAVNYCQMMVIMSKSPISDIFRKNHTVIISSGTVSPLKNKILDLLQFLMKNKLNLRIPEWVQRNKLEKEHISNVSSLARCYFKYQQVMYRTPLELELWKFNPKTRFSRFNFLTKFFGLFLGVNIYLYCNRIYEDEFKLRRRGDPISQEKSDFKIYMRQIKLLFHTWFLANLQLNWREYKQTEITSQSFEVPKYKENLIKAYQVDYYLKNRDKRFDFVQLAEKENFINTEN